MVLRGDGQELVEALEESRRILLPKQIVQEDSHGVHADGFCPSKLLVDLLRIERVGLPHLEFVDGVGWNEIAAH